MPPPRPPPPQQQQQPLPLPLPASLSKVARAFAGRFALYAPRDAGAMTIWRGMLARPFSPESDLLVAVPRVGNEAIFRLLVADAGPRIVVEHEPLLAVRPAHRGVTLAAILERRESAARPPIELLALVARALDRPGLRVQRITSPHQVVVSWDGDVLVDGLDPIARAAPWAPDVMRADVEACLLAAIARGRVDYSGARALVDEVASGTARATNGVVARAITDRFAAAQGRGHQLDDVVDVNEARTVVSGLVRGLFPEEVERDRLEIEELGTLSEEVLDAWTQRTTDVERANVASVAATGAEGALVATELAALALDARRAVAIAQAPAPSRASHVATTSFSSWQRFTRWLGELWHSLRIRVASARAPRVLPTRARPAPHRPVSAARRKRAR